MSLKMGELFAGYGGLGMGVADVLDVDLAWVSEFDKGPSKVLAHRFPDVPNHGDITKIDWSQVEPVDILTGGSPCQDLSHAGARKGMTEGTRSNLWVAMREATVSDSNGAGAHGDGGLDLRTAIAGLLPTPTTRDHKDHTIRREPHRPENRWGQYAAAIHRWESLTRPAPAPTETGPKGNPRLSAAFSEWLMGVPDGWITDVPGITRNEALKLAGNGVVPQQCAEALRIMLARMGQVAA